MSEMGYVFLGYAVCSVILAGYSTRLIVRGRRLSRSLPPEERTWR